MELVKHNSRAPEIYGDFWLNSDPLPLSALRGHVILVDFWDATCPFCFRGITYVKEWLRRYSDWGFVVIGVHSPKFPFEKDPSYVERILAEKEILYPVVIDNDLLIKNLFYVRNLPSRFLIDKSGFIRYRQNGEGSYQAFESAIQILLSEIGYHGEFPSLIEPIREEDRAGVYSYRATPEILVGYQNGNIGNMEGYFPQAIHRYNDPGIYLEGRIYLQGNFLINKHFVKYEATNGSEGSIIAKYFGKEVYCVVGAANEMNSSIFITQDGKYLTRENSGCDIKFDELGKSFLTISSPKLFQVIKNIEYGEHTLKLTCGSDGFNFYSISFVSAPIGESISRD
jgi:thiol-disulfide isomerase/thioredoxin